MAKLITTTNVRLKADLGTGSGYAGSIALSGFIPTKYYGGPKYMTWYQSKTFRTFVVGSSFDELEPTTSFPVVSIYSPYLSQTAGIAALESIQTLSISHNNYVIAVEWEEPYAPPQPMYFYGWYSASYGGGVFIDGGLTYIVPSTLADYNLWAYSDSGLIGCPLEGTMITMSDGTLKAIENLQLGDEVKSTTIAGMPDSTNLSSVTELYNWNDSTLNMSPDISTVVEIEPISTSVIININSGQLITSTSHTHIVKKQLIDGSYAWTCRGAFNIAVGDVLLSADGTEIEVTSVEKQQGQFTVYKLNVESNDTYIANGIITHNIK